MNDTRIQRPRRWSSIALVALWLSFPACARTCAASAQGIAEQRVGAWEFRCAHSQTWSALREMLRDDGYRGLPEALALNQSVEARADGERFVRVRLSGTPTAHTVEVIARVERADADGGARVFADAVTDRRLLWRLVQRVEPERASEVRRASEAQAERSRAAWSACDHFAEVTLENAARGAEQRTEKRERR
jgi:hypothetical protein